MSRLLKSLAFLVIALETWPSAAACSCAMAPGCHRLAIHDAMFTGEVLSFRTVEPVGDHWRQRVFRFRVTESFAGSQRVGDTVEVATGTGGGDCGILFAVGTHYLVDAYSYPGGPAALATGLCSATQPEQTAGIALLELRTLAARGRLPDLNGQILTAASIGGPTPGTTRPLVGISVTLTAKDGTAYHLRTDDTGIFSIATLPPGPYTADFALPPNRAISKPDHSKPIGFVIPESNGTGAGCHLSQTALPSGSISGHLLDGSGVGIKGFVAAYPEAQHDNRLGWAAATPTEHDGTFKLHFLQAGNYRLEYSADTQQGRPPLDQITNASVSDGAETAGLTLRTEAAAPASNRP